MAGAIWDFNLENIRENAFKDINSGTGLVNPGDPELTLGLIIQKIIPVIMQISGIILFLYFLWGGISYLLSFGNPEKTKAAWAKITQALIGFVIIFTSWWLIQLIEIVFGLTIVS